MWISVELLLCRVLLVSSLIDTSSPDHPHQTDRGLPLQTLAKQIAEFTRIIPPILKITLISSNRNDHYFMYVGSFASATIIYTKVRSQYFKFLCTLFVTPRLILPFVTNFMSFRALDKFNSSLNAIRLGLTYNTQQLSKVFKNDVPIALHLHSIYYTDNNANFTVNESFSLA